MTGITTHAILETSRRELWLLDRLTHFMLAFAWQELAQARKHADDPDGDSDDFNAPEVDFPDDPNRPVYFPQNQVQRKYQKHAPGFGFPKNYTKINGQKFETVLRNFINNPATEKQVGTYHRQPAIHYLNRETKMNVITYPNGEYWTNFTLTPEQLAHWPDIGGGKKR